MLKDYFENEQIAWDKIGYEQIDRETLKHLNLTPTAISDADPVSENIKVILVI